MPNSAPIGVYDSGLGGLTVWKAIRDRLLQERVVYYGDTANVPYGGRSAEEILRFSRDIISHLMMEQVKLIVVACNTSSAIALPLLAPEVPVPLIGMVRPSMMEAAKESKNHHIGLMATEGTVRSGAHARLLAQIAPECALTSQACPSLVPLIESGRRKHPEMQDAIAQCVKPLLTAHVDCIILGCTHYPLVREQIQAAVGNVQLIDPAVAVAEQAALLLRELDAENTTGEGDDAVYVSGDPDSFNLLAAELGFEFATKARPARAVVKALL